MTYSSTINLPAVKFHNPRIALEYREETVGLKQARFEGRRVLVPQIDLKAYTCRAVFDYVSIEVELKRKTHISHIRRELSLATGSSVYAKALDEGAGGSSTQFRLKLQEPHLHDILNHVAILDGEYGLVGAVAVESMEISIDFYSHETSNEHRGRFVGVLGRHLRVKRDVLSFRHDNPRSAWGVGRMKSNRTWKSPKGTSSGQFILDVENDRPIPYDATFYIGARGASTAWRVMDKIKDRQNIGAETVLALPDGQKRARVEVTLNRSELAGRGIRAVNDMLGHDWSTLQGDYFAFYLPTFLASEELGIGDRYWERQRLQRFLNVGIIGLEAMDKQLAMDRKKVRSGLVKHLRGSRRKIPPVARVGPGNAGTSMAYAELNERIRTALGTMQDHERRLLVKAAGYAF